MITRPQARPLHPAAREIIQMVRDHRRTAGASCVHCGSARIQRWGGFRGRQRYRCKACGRTFSDLTGTPMYRTRRLERWIDFLHLLQHSATIRASAHALDVHPTTTFRWRHRYLGAAARNANVALTGAVEVMAQRVPWSHKGSRQLGRRALRRGLCGVGQFRWPGRFEFVIHACDRQGGSVALATRDAGLPAFHKFAELLDPQLDAGRIDRVIGAGARLSAIARYCRDREVPYVDVPRAWRFVTRPGDEASLYAVADVARRFRLWLRRFCGVASRYLPNYLEWRRLLNEEWVRDPGRQWLVWALPRAPTPGANSA